MRIQYFIVFSTSFEVVPLGTFLIISPVEIWKIGSFPHFNPTVHDQSAHILVISLQNIFPPISSIRTFQSDLWFAILFHCIINPIFILVFCYESVILMNDQRLIEASRLLCCYWLHIEIQASNPKIHIRVSVLHEALR